MNILLGNLRTFESLGEKEKMNELENRLKELGYSNEDNCELNKDTSRLTWHIYDIPRIINFSVLDSKIIEILKSYSENFTGKVGVTSDLINN